MSYCSLFSLAVSRTAKRVSRPTKQRKLDYVFACSLPSMMSRAATLTFIGIALCHVQTAFGFNLFIDRDFGVNVLHWGGAHDFDSLLSLVLCCVV